MTEALAARLDLDLAWRRTKWDVGNRNFVSHPFELDVLNLSLADWLEQLRSEIADGSYSAKDCEILDFPKPGFLVRPAARLECQDYLVYCALGQVVMDCVHGPVRALLNIDYSYQPRRSRDAVPWFTWRLRGWQQFAAASIRRLEQGATHVVFTDLVGFYENVDLERIRYALLSVGMEAEALGLLMKCLRKWAGPRGRGIPQGTSVSDLLAKLYLEPVDHLLRRSGFHHLRYVDDVRVFCTSHVEAKKAIQKITALMRERGLSLQSAKTEIHDAAAARAKIEGGVPEIQELEQQLVGEARRQFGWIGQYLYPDDLKRLQRELAEGATREAIETAFRERVLAPDRRFDASLFHYLLKRLGAVNSPIAQEFAIRQMTERPEETAIVLDYLKQLGPLVESVRAMVECAESADTIYDFQRFEILRWLWSLESIEEEIKDVVLGLARSVIEERGAPLWLRAFGVALLGRHGDGADLEAIEEHYPTSLTELERAIVLCALQRMHKARRNAVYARSSGDGFLVASAIRWVKTQDG